MIAFNRQYTTVGAWLVRARVGTYVDGHAVYRGVHRDPTERSGLVRLSGDRVFRVDPGFLVPRPYLGTWASWRSVYTRTSVPGCDGYERYRHVEVYQPWLPSFYGSSGTLRAQWLALAAFCASVGVRPDGCTLDRLEGRYWPGEVRWATPGEQRRNQR